MMIRTIASIEQLGLDALAAAFNPTRYIVPPNDSEVPFVTGVGSCCGTLHPPTRLS